MGNVSNLAVEGDSFQHSILYICITKIQPRRVFCSLKEMNNIADLGVVHRATPETQHKWAERNLTAYTWLYVGGSILITRLNTHNFRNLNGLTSFTIKKVS
jgi:hypothetical protein